MADHPAGELITAEDPRWQLELREDPAYRLDGGIEFAVQRDDPDRGKSLYVPWSTEALATTTTLDRVRESDPTCVYELLRRTVSTPDVVEGV